MPRPALRVLHARHAHDDQGAAGREPRSVRARDPRPRSPARSAAARATRTSSPRSRWAAQAGGPGGRPPVDTRRHRDDRDRGPADRLRAAQAQGGRPLHPRQGHLPGRHPPARDAPRRDPAQPVRAREDQLDRHRRGARGPERRRGDHGQGPGDARPRVDADDLLRHAGRAGRRQGALPAPGGRVRDRDRRVLGPRRAAADRGRLRPAARRGQRPQGARRRRAADPRRQGRAGRQPRQPDLGGGRRGRDRQGVRRGRHDRVAGTSSTRAATRRRWRRAG